MSGFTPKCGIFVRNRTGHGVVNCGFFSPAILKFVYWDEMANLYAFKNAGRIITIIGKIK